MELFKEGWVFGFIIAHLFYSFFTCCSKCHVFVCTDVAGMGIDVKDLNFSINIGRYLFDLCLGVIYKDF